MQQLQETEKDPYESAFRAAKGSPKPKRTKVAPVVPSRPFKCFCNAERAFWQKAAKMVIGIQSSMAPAHTAWPVQAVARIRACRPHRRTELRIAPKSGPTALFTNRTFGIFCIQSFPARSGCLFRVFVMSPLTIAYGSLLVAILFEVTGSSLLQKSEQFSRLGPTIGMAVCFLAALFFLSQALKAIPLGVAYAIWSGIGVVLTALIGVVVFRFALDAAALVGMGLIVAGVIVINVFSKSAAH